MEQVFLFAIAWKKNDPPNTITLHQKIGRITLTIEANDPNSKIFMHAPLPTFGKVIEDRLAITNLLGIKEEMLMEYPIQIVSCGVPFVIVPVKEIQQIKQINFRLDLWQNLQSIVENAFVYAFCPEGELRDSDLHGRMFAPDAGILEDPATGGANGPLACYCSYYSIKKGPLTSEQGFEMGRPSILYIEALQNDGHFEDVIVGGDSVIIGQGKFFLD